MNYLRQLNEIDCAPVALINAYIFLGYKVNKKKLHKKFCKLLKIKNNGGAYPKDFDKLVKKLFPKIKKIKDPVADELSACIIAIDYDGWGHVGLVIKVTNHYVYLVNWGDRYPLIRKVRKDTLNEWLSEWSVAYLLKKC